MPVNLFNKKHFYLKFQGFYKQHVFNADSKRTVFIITRLWNKQMNKQIVNVLTIAP